jgi:hypothetical protein
MRLTDPKAGDWDYDGACVNESGWETVSIGIFQWILRANGKGVKRGKVVKRIRGPRGNLAALCMQAEAWILNRDSEQVKAGADGAERTS